jgi:hypothetical protein
MKKEKSKPKQYFMHIPCSALEYVEEVMGRKRFPPVEDLLMTDPVCAAGYAIRVLRGRWKEAEPIIRKSYDAWRPYLSNFHKRFTVDEQCAWIKDAELNEDLISFLNHRGIKRRVQRLLIEKRPDLIGHIEKLDSRLKKKCSFELNLVEIEI